jgi:hypothetical protein
LGEFSSAVTLLPHRTLQGCEEIDCTLWQSQTRPKR